MTIESIKNYFKNPRNVIPLVSVAVLVAGLAFFYLGSRTEDVLAQFELTPKIGDSAGVAPETTFILKSSVPLQAKSIAERLKIEPEVEVDVREVSAQTFEIKPKSALKENTVYAVQIEESPIAERTYSWAYQVKAPFRVTGTLPRHQGSGVPLETGIEITFNREGVENGERFVEVSPATPGRFELHRNVLVFVPASPLQSKTVYTVKVKPGIKAAGSDDQLAEEQTFQFETIDASAAVSRPVPYFAFDRTFWEFAPTSGIALEVSHGNILSESVRLDVYRFGNVDEFTAAYMAAYKREYSWTNFHSYAPYIPSADKRVASANVPIEEQLNIEFVRVPQRLPEGQYLADVIVGDEHRQAWFQVTPIVSFFAMSPGESVVWLKDVTNGSNLAGAEVRFDGNVQGKTESGGVVSFNTPAALVSERTDKLDYNVYADRGGDFYIASWQGHTVAIPIVKNYGGYRYMPTLTRADEWWDFLSLDKTIYLPRDTLHFWGVAKHRNTTDIRGEELTVQLTNTYWGYWGRESTDDVHVYAEAKARVSDFYTVTGELRFADLAPGLYQLNVRRGNEVIISASVNVQAYVRPNYRLKLSADRNAIFAGDTINYTARAEFFDGTPVGGMDLKYRGYFESDREGTLRLNNNGEAPFAVPTEYQQPDPDNYYSGPMYRSVYVTPAMAEEGEITADAYTLVFGSHMYLRAQQSFAGSTSTYRLRLNQVDLDRVNKGENPWDYDHYMGAAVTNWDITADVTEVIYHQTEIGRNYDPINKVTYPVYSYSTEYKPVTKQTLKTNGAGEAAFTWTPEEKKMYRIIFSASDSQARPTRQLFYAYGASYSPFSDYDIQGVSLESLDPNKSDYRLGESIRLQVRNNGGSALPPGQGHFLYLEAYGDTMTHHAADTGDYGNTFKPEYIPNVQVVGVWFSGKRFHDAYWHNLSFDADERRLTIEPSRDKERYRPGETVNLNIRVTDKNNAPRKAEVNIGAIDEAIFSLNPEEQDILNDLYRDIFVYVSTRSSNETRAEAGAEGGGCFTEGTQILTPQGLYPIEELHTSDEVLTRKSIQDATLVRATITARSVHPADEYLVINGELKLTPNHELFVNGAWQKAGQIEIGDRLMGADGKNISVRTIKAVRGWLPVYNIEVGGYHTFVADGIWVHNAEKGGAETRSDFREVPIYRTVETDGDGRASVSFKLPDTVTSWRLTLQGITKDLFAGKNITSVPASLPFFVEGTLNRTYLAGDNVLLRGRTFGTAGVTSNITYTVEAPMLPGGKIERTGGSTVEIPLGALPAGAHKLRISARSGDLRDAIEKPLTVLDTYFTRRASRFYEVNNSLASIEGGTRGLTTIQVASYAQGRLYSALQSLSYAGGSRVDQRIAAQMAQSYLNKFFSETHDVGTIDAHDYQTFDGGIAFLPYSSSDVALSAKFAHLASAEDVGINRGSLASYLRPSGDARTMDIHEYALRLYGMSAFREPVLMSIQRLKEDKNLGLPDRVYIALALDALGAREEARQLYMGAIREQLTTQAPYMYLRTFKNEDENIVTTALIAELAARIGQPSDARMLSEYVLAHAPKETLDNLETLLYVKEALPRVKRRGDVTFTFETSKGRETKVLRHPETFTRDFAAEELATLRFLDVQGELGLTTSFYRASSPAEIILDSMIGVTRTYQVNGRNVTDINEGDLVKIQFVPRFLPTALDGTYEIIDHLPSGLRAITQPYAMANVDQNYAYPSLVNDQEVRFIVSKDYPHPFYYYARVVSKGTYKAEPALIQSMLTTESANLSNSVTITIK